MNTYEEKKAARIERYRNYSANACTRSDDAYKRAKSIGDNIPMGQPILVGHHSERRARTDQKRIHNAMDKSCKELDKANYWESRAKSAENSRAIDSSDPEALTKLKEKIARCEKSREMTKAFNARLRKYKTWEALKELENDHKDFNLKKHVKTRRSYYANPPEETRRYYLNTSSNSAEIKKLTDRIKAIESQGTFESFEVLGHRVELNDGQYQIFCEWKPNKESRALLKSYPASLKWSRYSEAWVRKHTASTNHYWVQSLKEILLKLESE